MILRVRNLQSFLSSQNFTDGLKTTFCVLLPSVLLAQADHIKFGFFMSLGALTVSIIDLPGPVNHKRNGMLLCCLAIFLMALITGYIRPNEWLLGIEIAGACFFFSMFAVFGNRSAALGTSAILVMIVVIGQKIPQAQVLNISCLILSGGVWYMLFSLLLNTIRPYRQAQQVLGDCIRETAAIIRIKAQFYNPETDLDADYQKLVAKQVQVNEKQEAVREILFKSRQLVKDSNPLSRRLLLAFVDVVDMYEQVMAIQYDYSVIREKYQKSPLLLQYSTFINRLADELDNIGFAIQSNTKHTNLLNLHAELSVLKEKTNNAGITHQDLDKVVRNMEGLLQNLQDIAAYFKTKSTTRRAAPAELDFSRFVSHQDISWKTLRNNLSRSSTIFKHAVRVSVACFFGFLFTKWLAYGEYSHWVILTIIVILKPAFSLTKQRNIQRLTGTLTGGIIGVIILITVSNTTLQFLFLVVFMILTFSFIRVNYILAVIFMTPFILILFNFMGADNLGVARERVLDTLLGSVIAFAASYILFPNWEREQIRNFMRNAVQADINYLEKLIRKLKGEEVLAADYKLARKEVYVSSANLSAAFQRMLSEPKSKQQNSSNIHKFVVINHVLSANIATVASAVMHQESTVLPTEGLKLAEQANLILSQALEQFSDNKKAGKPLVLPAKLKIELPVSAPDNQVLEQLQFIRKVSYDLIATLAVK